MSPEFYLLSSWQGALFEPLLDPTTAGDHIPNMMSKVPHWEDISWGIIPEWVTPALLQTPKLLCWLQRRLSVCNSVSAAMANWHARDICGLLLLLLVFTEAARKWAFVQDLSDVQIKQMIHTHDSAIHPARRLLEPQVKSGYQTQALCRTEQDCEDGVGVTCMQGNVVACNCDYIAMCFPDVKKCTVYNSTHVESCGF